ncbi:unnamed protein product [Ixodes hexagonus]
MEDPNGPCHVGDACAPVQGAEAPPFTEGDQALVRHDKDKPEGPDLNEPGCPTRKLTEALPDDRSERIPSRMVEDRGDDEISPLYRRSPVMQDKPTGGEVVGDNARLQVSAPSKGPELSLDPTILRFISSDAALDEGYMVSELLKKGRLKNSTFTEKGLVVQEGGEAQTVDAQVKEKLSVILEATQNITLRYQVLGTMGTAETKENAAEETPKSALRSIADPRQTCETAGDIVSKSPRVLSSSDEMLYFKEKVRNAPGPAIERKGASCSKLHVPNLKAAAIRAQVFERSPALKTISKSTLPPAYSPSQLNISKVKSQIAELTLKKSARLSQVSLCGRQPDSDDAGGEGGTNSPAVKKMSKITQIVLSASKPFTTSVTADDVSRSTETENPKNEKLTTVSSPRATPKTGLTRSRVFTTHADRRLSEASCERLPSAIKDMPVLDVLEQSEFPMSPAEKARLRVKRYYRREEDFFAASPSVSSNESLVKLDLSNIPTEASELAGDRCRMRDAAEADNNDESLTSWYSFDSEPRGSQRSDVVLCDAKPSTESSWRSYMKSINAAPEMNMTRLAGLFYDASTEVQKASSDQGLGSSSGSDSASSNSTSTSSLDSRGSCDPGDGDSRAVSTTETVIDRKNALEASETESLKASNLIRYFESIH